MENLVYLVRDEGGLIREKLSAAGYEVAVGGGKFQDDLLGRCCGLVLGKERLTQEVLNRAPHLKVVGKFGVGVDRIDIPACTARGVYVVNTPLANYISVAEHTLALIMTSAKKIYQISLYLRHEYPDYWCRERYQGVELAGKTLSVIGLGNIGRRVALLAHGIGMEIVGYDPYLDKSRLDSYIQPANTLEDAMAAGDFVTVHVAGGDSTRHMISARELALMKPSAILVNVSRGFVVHEADLIQALQNRVIAGAALDVFAQEPIQPGNPLMLMENVVATPHCAGNTKDARLRAQAECADNIIAALEGRRPPCALNTPAQ